jgi:hypothetical protein
VFGRRRAIIAVLATAFAVLALGQPIPRGGALQAAALFVSNPPPSRGYTVMASVGDDGGPLVDWSDEPQISGDGKWQVFTTDSSACAGCFSGSVDYPDPDPLDPDSGVRRVFVRNLDPNAPQFHRTVQVSIGNSTLPDPNVAVGTIMTPDGTDPDNYSELGSISADGRYVSFITYALNIVPTAPNPGQLTLVACDRDPTGAKDANGNYIFDTIPAGTNTRDYRCRGIYTTSGIAQGALSFATTPRLSPDGSQIVFAVSNDFSGTDVMLAKVSDSQGLLTAAQAGSPVKVSGMQPHSDDSEAIITSLGYVVMRSVMSSGTQTIVRTNVVTNPQQVVRVDTDPTDSTKYLGNRTYNCGSITCDVTIDQPTISDNGSTVLFHYGGEDQDPIGSRMVLVRDVGFGSSFQKAEAISRGNATSAEPNGPEVFSDIGAISGNGRFVVFAVYDEDPATHDGTVKNPAEENEYVARDVVRDLLRRQAGEPRLPGALVTAAARMTDPDLDCTPVAPALYCDSEDYGYFEDISLSTDGSRIGFNSDQRDLIPGDEDTTGDVNGEGDVFVRTWTPQLSNGTSDLGEAQVNTRTQANVPVQVLGFGPVRFAFDAQPTVGGPDPSQFAVTATTCVSGANRVYFADDTVFGSCVVAVEFKPTTLGSKTATISLQPSLYRSAEVVRTVTGVGVATGPVSAAADNTRSSVRNNGGQSPEGGDESMISGNGRWQVFVSPSNLAGHTPIDPADAGSDNVFVRDLADPQHTVQISLHMAVANSPSLPSRTASVAGHPTGASPNDDSSDPTISSDGRFVSFFTDATDIVPYPPMDPSDTPDSVIVVCDRDPTNTKDSAGNPILDLPRKGTTVPNYVCFPIQSSAFSAGGDSADGFTTPRLSGDGTRVTWVEESDGANPRVRVATLSTPGGQLQAPTNFQYVPTDIEGFEAGTTRSVEDAEQRDPSLTEDGSAVVYRVGFCGSSFSSCIVQAIVVTDISAGTSTRFDIVPGGSTFLGDACATATAQCRIDPPAVSDDGNRVAFALRAPTDDFRQVYVATRTGTSVSSFIASRDNTDHPTAGAHPALSGDGRYLAYQSSLPNSHNGVDPPNGDCFVDSDDTNVNCQIVARDLVKDLARVAAGQPRGPSELVSSSINTVCPNPLPPGRRCGSNGFSDNPSIDETGSEIGFDSDSSDIVPGDDNLHDTGEGFVPATDAFVHTWRPTLNAPAAFDFGTVKLGAHKDKTFTVTESGFGPISLGATTITGTNAAEFTVLNTTCAGATLNDTETCTIKLRFTPSVAGSRTATLSTAVGKNGYPRHNPDSTIFYDPALIRTLTGVGSSAELEPDPTTVNFGDNLPLAPGKTKTLVINNTGTSTLNLTDVVVQDTTHPGARNDYTVNATDCLGGIPPGGSCVITVTFVGHAVGNRGAVLVITDNAPTGPTSIVLLANVPKPKVTVNPGVSPPGRVTIVNGTGFAPNLQVDVALKGSLERATVITDAQGKFEVGLVLFTGTVQGPHFVTGHTHGASATISGKGPLLITLGSVNIPQLVTRH